MSYRRKYLNQDTYIRTTSKKRLNKFMNKLSDESIMIGKSFSGELFKSTTPYEGVTGEFIAFSIVSYNGVVSNKRKVHVTYFGYFTEFYYEYKYNVIDLEGNHHSLVIQIVDKLCYPKGTAKVYAILTNYPNYVERVNLILNQFRNYKLDCLMEEEETV